MTNQSRKRLVFHSAIILFAGLFFGILDVADELSGGTFRGWRSAQLAMLATGIWVLATASISSLLLLEKREAAGLFLSLLAAGYGFMLAGSIEAINGVRAIGPFGPASNLVAFAGNVIGLFGASLAVLLTLMGARAALEKKEPRPSEAYDTSG